MSDAFAELAALGSATVHEAAARSPVVDVDLVQVLSGSRAAGPARTVRCGQDDNLMVHAAIAEAQPGEVLVVTMPEPAPVALVGELLATQAKHAGCRGDARRRGRAGPRGPEGGRVADLGALRARTGRGQAACRV